MGNPEKPIESILPKGLRRSDARYWIGEYRRGETLDAGTLFLLLLTLVQNGNRELLEVTEEEMDDLRQQLRAGMD